MLAIVLDAPVELHHPRRELLDGPQHHLHRELGCQYLAVAERDRCEREHAVDFVVSRRVPQGGRRRGSRARGRTRLSRPSRYAARLSAKRVRSRCSGVRVICSARYTARVSRSELSGGGAQPASSIPLSTSAVTPSTSERKVISERLGHATPAFTMATYQHVLPGMQAEAARTFADVIASTGFNPVDESVDVA